MEQTRKRFQVVACEILFREVCRCAAQSVHIIDPVFLPKGLHDMGEKKMTQRLQQVLDQIDPANYDAVLLVYGLCNNGIRGLRARLPIVVPRAHDCITLLLGSKEKYQAYFDNNPGTYFKSSGWLERDSGSEDDQSITSQLGINRTHQEYVEQYGEENAAYLMDMLGDFLHQYSKIAYIDTGTGDIQTDIETSRRLAEDRSWSFETVKGDIRLIQQLMDGNWDDEDFLVVEPSCQIMPSYDRQIITSLPSE